MNHSITLRYIGVIYLGSLVLCTIGTYAAYWGPFSSGSWQAWALATGVNPPLLDIVRAIGSAVLALFALHCMDLVDRPRVGSDAPLSDLRLRPYEKWVVGGAALAVVLVSTVALPLMFRQSYIGLVAGCMHPYSTACKALTHVPNALSYREIFVPYFAYGLYVAGLWLGIVTPVFLALIRSIRYDRSDWARMRAATRPLRGNAPPTSRQLSDYVNACKSYVAAITDAGKRYIPVFVVVIAAALAENLTDLDRTTTEGAASIGKIVLWLIWIPSLLIATYLFLILYDNAVKSSKAGIAHFVDAFEGQDGMDAELATARTELETFDEKRSSLSALMAVVKTGNIGVAVLVALTTGALAALFHANHWADAFFPRPFLNWVSGVWHNFGRK